MDQFFEEVDRARIVMRESVFQRVWDSMASDMAVVTGIPARILINADSELDDLQGYAPVAAPNFVIDWDKPSATRKTISFTELHSLAFKDSIAQRLKSLDDYFVKPIAKMMQTRMLFEIYFDIPKQLLLTYTPKKDPNEQ